MITVPCRACHDGIATFPLIVCYSDRDDVRRCLVELIGWHEAMLLPPVRPSSGMPGAKVREQPSPLSDRVTEVRELIQYSLIAWARWHQCQGDPSSTTIHSARAAAIYLRNIAESDILSNEQVAAEYVHKMARLAHIAQRTATPSRREGVVIAIHDAGDCDLGSVWAKDLNGTGKCAGCGREETVAWWHQHYPPSSEDLLTDAEAIEYILVTYGQRVTRATLRQWRKRGHIPPAEAKRDGRVATHRRTLDRYLTVTSDLATTG